MIARADGSVLYNFAVAVDDVDGRFTHVVRGEDHLSNTPKQLLVMEAMGAEPPLFAHLPLLHGPDGKKLSKRHGAASVQELRDGGLPARGGAQLPRAARLGRPRRRDDPRHRAARRPLRHRARVAQPRALRRAEAALAQRPLHPLADRRAAHGRASSATPAAPGCATRWRSRARRSRRSRTSGRSPGSSSTGRPTTRRRARSGSPTAGRCAARCAAALDGVEPFSVEDIERALGERARAARRQAARRLPAAARRGRGHDGVARHLRDASRCSAATSRSGASTPP